LDDHDVYICIKRWSDCDDLILSDLCRRFLSRKLFRTTFADRKKRDELHEEIRTKTKKYLKKQGFPYDDESASYYYDADESYSEAYRYKNESIWILEDNNKAVEFSKSADTKHIIALTEPVVKPYLVHLKEL